MRPRLASISSFTAICAAATRRVGSSGCVIGTPLQQDGRRRASPLQETAQNRRGRPLCLPSPVVTPPPPPPRRPARPPNAPPAPPTGAP
ncbi:MAG: hypothetical protein FJZ90_01375 [Chloroflexi bacterium]|nr:hypothetical protein [Chloroflexota bacterium]